MAKRRIVTVPDEILTKKCRPVETFDQKLWDLLDDMKETLLDANGAGLAAPQVAILKRVCIVNTDAGYFELVNPRLIRAHGTQTDIEGCLSVPKKYGKVTRAMKIVVRAFDRYGKEFEYKVSGFTARAFQHEMDHLDGIIYTSKCQGLEDEE